MLSKFKLIKASKCRNTVSILHMSYRRSKKHSISSTIRKKIEMLYRMKQGGFGSSKRFRFRRKKSKKKRSYLQYLRDEMSDDMKTLIGNASYTGFFLALMCTDMLSLRLVNIVAQFGAVGYNLLQKNPHKLPLYWASLFLTVNFVQVGIILNSRKTIGFSDYEMEFYALLFKDHAILPKQFRKLLNAGEWKTFNAGEFITEQGVENDAIYFVVNGHANVYIDKVNIGDIKSGSFIGEVTYFQSQELLENIKCDNTKKSLLQSLSQSLNRRRRDAIHHFESENSNIKKENYTEDHADYHEIIDKDAPLKRTGITIGYIDTFNNLMISSNNNNNNNNSTSSNSIIATTTLETDVGETECNYVAAAATASVKTTIPLTCFVVKHTDMAVLTKKNPDLKHCIAEMMTRDLVGKLTEAGESRSSETYAVMLHMSLLDGYVDDIERKELAKYQILHDIPESLHNNILHLHGWTESDWEKGGRTTGARILHRFGEIIQQNIVSTPEVPDITWIAD